MLQQSFVRLITKSTVASSQSCRMKFWKPCSLASLSSISFTSAAFNLHPDNRLIPRKRPQQTAVRQFSNQKDSGDNSDSFATSYHAPVMWKECIDALLSCRRSKLRQDGNGDGDPLIFVDATLGGGGHSAALLKELQPGDIVFGCDVDPTALSTASERLQAYLEGDNQLPLFVPVRSNFCGLATKLPQVVHPKTQEMILKNGVDGILMDLGVSSHQIDTAERGFAFMKDGPLDMRMGKDGALTAADICNEFDANEIQRILKVYGDEPRARAIAQSIVNRRPLYTTFDLMEAVAAVTPQFVKKSRRMGRTATLARVFQSLRIVVNQEDKVLEKALMEMCPALLRPGGRLAVLSYHSLEDRAAKLVMRDGTVKRESRNDERDIYGNYIGTPRPFRTLGKPQKASEDEVESNPRARSARLRVAERSES